MDFKLKLQKLLEQQLKTQVVIETPPSLEFGDFAVHSYKLKHKPEDLKAKLKLSSFIQKTEIKGPYLNFFLKKELFAKETIKEILKKKSKYGSEKSKKQTIVIDYSSPNIAKPFSIAHLRSTAIGNSIQRISEKLGYKVIGINHLGDWGTQFGKLIYAYKTWGSEKELKKDPIQHLLNIYIKFHEEAKLKPELDEEGKKWFVKLEKGDASAKKLWKIFTTLSLKEFNKIYKKLGIKFTHTTGESFYEPLLDPTIKFLEKKNLVKEDQGALVVHLEQFNMPPCILKKSDDASIYGLRDIAAAIYRYNKFKFSRMFYIVDSRQALHFQQFFKVLELANYSFSSLLEHVNFGTMHFEEGVMSTREGKVVFMEDVLSQTESKVLKIIKQKNPTLKNKDKVAQQVAIGAIIFWDLSHDRVKDIDFSWEKLLDFQGETGPYIQYTNARALSILENQKTIKSDFSKLSTKQEIALINHLSIYNETINQSFNNLKPSTLAHYLIILAQLFNEFYSECPVRSADEKVKAARIKLVKSVSFVLENGLSLLGIETPKEM